MADDDEIDILGDFSFNSCFAQNNQGIPSCSSREDTVHPQWLLDSTVVNWYDKDKEKMKSTRSSGPSRQLIGDRTVTLDDDDDYGPAWSPTERKLLLREMAKYGRNVKKLSQLIKSKTEAEIQALIDAEYGVNLETSSYGIDKCDESDNTPTPSQEEIVTDTKKIVIIQPQVNSQKHPFKRKNYNKKSILKQPLHSPKVIDDSEIFYDEDMVIGSTELIGSELDLTDVVSKNIAKYQAKVKAEKKIGNHRRKVSRNYDKTKRNRSQELKSPQGRQRKDSSVSDDSVKSPKLQIVLGSGQALPISEGEQVIKIEKKKDSEPESDIDIDVDSDNEASPKKDSPVKQEVVKPSEEPIAVPLRKFEPMPKRQKRIKMDGGGGYTIMHTAAGDLYEVGTEPKRERQPRKQPIHLIRCRFYNSDKPAPFSVQLHVSALIRMDVHGHTSRGEVMGLAGGTQLDHQALLVSHYAPARASASHTHCDMDPVSAASSAEQLLTYGSVCVGWHHSHPEFAAAPSLQDLNTQVLLQRADCRQLVAFITSQHWTMGRTATHYRCFRVEEEPNGDPTGYQLSVKLVPDINVDTLPTFLEELASTVLDAPDNEYSVNMGTHVCPIANITYLEKCVSSISHHMRSAGYSDDDPVTAQLIHGFREVFR